MVRSGNEVEEREEEDPDDVDEVPVETHHFDRTVVLGAEMVLPRTDDEVDEQAGPDDHVQRVQAGHAPVEGHEELYLRGEGGVLMPREEASDEEALFVVRVILDHLDGQEGAAEDESGEQHRHLSLPPPELRL